MPGSTHASNGWLTAVIHLDASWPGLFKRTLHPLDHPVSWLIGLGLLCVGIYLWAWSYGPFRPDRIEPFFWMFGAACILYAIAVWVILKTQTRIPLGVIFGFAVLFNVVLLFTRPTLSDDMYRYIWDGRVQGHGINPYRFASSAPELASLRDDNIWTRMNRIDAITIYPPGAQIVYAVLWRLVGDSIFGFKLFMTGCTLICGWLLAGLLQRLDGRPDRVLIFLWHPLLSFEIAHAGHVDALYLPLIVGAMLLRATAPSDRASLGHEAAIGFLLGAATLVKLYPVMLLVPFWSVRDMHGQRRRRLALPVMLFLTIAAGYALYIAPGVDTLGFLPTDRYEFFNIGPLPMALVSWAQRNHIDFYLPVLILMPVCVCLISFWFLIFPARSAREAIQRCAWPIGIYLLISQNLFSWYVLWILPLVTLDLHTGRWLGWRLNPAMAWWVFSVLVVLSYTLFITGYAQEWASDVQFLPVYALLALSVLSQLRRSNRAKEKGLCLNAR
jgi:alpha-1,6-mannosyltransferase